MSEDAHIPDREKRQQENRTRVNTPRTGVPGWVVWCRAHTTDPTTERDDAERQLHLAGIYGCPHEHTIRPVLIREDGRYYFCDRGEPT